MFPTVQLSNHFYERFCVFFRQSVCLYVIACYACTLELRRINIRNVLMSDDSCQVKWGSVKQDNTVLPVTVWILQLRSELKLNLHKSLLY